MHLQIGDPTKMIEMDESNIDKQKCHRGHVVGGQWVYGCIKRETNKCFLVPMKDCSKRGSVSSGLLLSLKTIEDLSFGYFRHWKGKSNYMSDIYKFIRNKDKCQMATWTKRDTPAFCGSFTK